MINNNTGKATSKVISNNSNYRYKRKDYNYFGEGFYKGPPCKLNVTSIFFTCILYKRKFRFQAMKEYKANKRGQLPEKR